jgi:hypothetical protein
LRGARLVEKHWLLEKLSFIFPDIELVPYGLEVQNRIWERVIEYKKSLLKKLKEYESLREKYKDYSAYKWINVGEFRILKDFVERIDKNATSTEGLERLLSFIEENPKLEESVHLFENNNRFLREYASDFCRMVEYIQNPDLVIPRDLMDERRLIIEQIKNGKREEAIKCFENFFEKFISLYT